MQDFLLKCNELRGHQNDPTEETQYTGHVSAINKSKTTPS